MLCYYNLYYSLCQHFFCSHKKLYTCPLSTMFEICFCANYIHRVSRAVCGSTAVAELRHGGCATENPAGILRSRLYPPAQNKKALIRGLSAYFKLSIEFGKNCTKGVVDSVFVTSKNVCEIFNSSLSCVNGINTEDTANCNVNLHELKSE